MRIMIKKIIKRGRIKEENINKSKKMEAVEFLA